MAVRVLRVNMDARQVDLGLIEILDAVEERGGRRKVKPAREQAEGRRKTERPGRKKTNRPGRLERAMKKAKRRR